MKPSSSAHGGLFRIQLALVCAALSLTVAGILFVHSATTHGEAFPSREARGQIGKAVVGLLALAVAARLDYRFLDRHAYLVYGSIAAILAFMLIVKAAAGGRNRFINVYIFQIQPSELMRIGIILALARYLRFREDQRRVFGLVGPFALTIMPMALVLLQPNLGLSLMFPPILIGMLFVAGAKPRHLLIAMLLGVALLPAAYFLSDKVPLLHYYQRDRLRTFLVRDEASARNPGFQLQQSLIAIGSGGPGGKGYGEGTQNTLEHLPEKDTDFIFSVIAEELGFAGAASVVLVFWVLVAAILAVAYRTREPFARLTACGIGIAFAAQAFENMGMTMGLTPITGIALPFVSLAGSNLVTSHFAVGIVLGIASRRVRVVATRDLDPPERRTRLLVLEDQPAALLQGRWPVD